MITSHQRGHLIKYIDGAWVYADTNESITTERPCARCGRPPTHEGHDECLGIIDGATSACCGHGVEDGYTVSGDHHG
ncbi:hypothetical protein [Desulfosporosinus nitroreducens]|uniref:hypothetical protein n=1 Tax=Desulfosporosinus nitroreducens TaxID=2018668 RepID=UPI00207C59BB|nr:hypothetical protein [Desulfosporosinus nitroreducens]MCO1599839.1 hypothetical protein [Desulfosporosinus nitroreducens]